MARMDMHKLNDLLLNKYHLTKDKTEFEREKKEVKRIIFSLNIKKKKDK